MKPDITTLAKPLAGGIPMSATLCTNEVARAFHAGMHGTTFGGGPLACAVAIAVIDHIENDNLLAHVTEIGEYFQQKLRELAKKHTCITDVRGKGLMLAVELDSAELPSTPSRRCSKSTSSSTAPATRCCVSCRRTSSSTSTSITTIAALDEFLTETCRPAH